MGGLVQIRVEGLDEFRKALRQASKDLPKALQRANKKAVTPIAEDARRRYEQRYTRRTGRGARSIRPLASQRRAQVAFGGKRTPYVIGQEFGSNRLRQFAPWTGKGPGGAGSRGRFLYPAAREGMDRLRDEYEGIVERELRPAFPK